jgi:hydrogenase large subunit
MPEPSPDRYKIFLPEIEKGKEPEGQPTATPSPTETVPPAPTATPTGTPLPPGSSQKIAIDPITRIEGHLRVEVKIEDGYVTDAWSSGTMFRGVELLLPGRDPRDAWIYTQRICGVCTTVHAICSVRAVENALGITIPDNARLIRNLIEAAQYVQDHVIHFYHLHALDWVDIVSALSADPAATSELAQSISDWPNSSPEYFTQVRDRLQTFVDSGQLGLFANAYWSHPAYKLPAEGNLLAVAHYLEALDWQREVIKMHAVLGGKNPHPQTYLVGGMALPVDGSSRHALNAERITQLRGWAAQALDFVQKVYIPDLLLVASFYKDWAGLGGGVGNFMSYGDFPADTSGDPAALWLPQGVVLNKNLGAPPLPLDHTLIKEYVTRSWYSYADGDGAGKHPWQGETSWNYTGPQPPFDFLDTDGKYSWLKAPRYDDTPMEVGPLARMVVAYAAGHGRVRQVVDQVLAALEVGPESLFSTLGRVAARGIETLVVAEKLEEWIAELEGNMNRGDLAIHNGALWDPGTWPAQAMGYGMTEAPRGALGHWVQIENGTIANYQCVVSTTWNGSPRDAMSQRGPWEEALVGTPVADPAKPVEILRTVHSFDPCMACSVHVLDPDHREITRIQVV